MNDLLAPILVVFVMNKINVNFFSFENNIRDYEQRLTESTMIKVT